MSAAVKALAKKAKRIFHTPNGEIVLADCVDYLRRKVEDASVDLIVTSPPFGLVRKKEYGGSVASAHNFTLVNRAAPMSASTAQLPPERQQWAPLI